MAKWATSSVVLALLGCALWTMVNAGWPPHQQQPQPWHPKHPHHHKKPGPPIQEPGHHHQHHHHQGGIWPPYQPYQPNVNVINHDAQQGAKKPPLDQTLLIPDPNLPVVQDCAVDLSVRIPCGATGISASGCAAINCCFDGSHCFYGKAVTVQCTKDGQFIVVVARDATLPHIDLESISLLGDGPNCKHVDSNSAFVIYNFPVTACGTVVMEEPGVIIYENRMISSYVIAAGPYGTITRDSHFQLLFQARYIGTAVETLIAEVLPLKDPPLPVAAYGPIRVALALANGQCATKGCNEVDAAYTSYYSNADYPVTKILRDSVYVEVRLLEKTDPHLVLTLGRCWTTTTPNPHSLPQWDILVNGCPYTDDRYLSSLVPVSPSSVSGVYTHYRRFFFKMFTFVEGTTTKKATTQNVYIHCSTALCIARPGSSCEPSCYGVKKNKRDVEAAEQEAALPKIVVSVGPVEMSELQTDGDQ